MKVVFFSSSSNAYDGSSFHYTAYPACCSHLEALAGAYPEHEFAVVARLPAFFLVDLENDGSFVRKARGVEYVLLDAGGAASGAAPADMAYDASKVFAAAIAALSPDIAIAATCWMTPFDWLPLEDALIAEKLEKAGIRTLCHSTASAELCFDKRETRMFLKAHRIPAPESIFLDHELYRVERGHSEIAINPYKERIFALLEKLNYPVVIKDTTGLSSFGLDVVNSPKAAHSILESRKTRGDRLIEEFVSGDQFGVEVYGTPGYYQVMTPFLFSVTQYGITSPKQSVKLSVSGNEAETRFHLVDMRRLVTDMAEALELRGAAQFDLVFRGASGVESGQEPSCTDQLERAVSPETCGMCCDGAASSGNGGMCFDGAVSPEKRGSDRYGGWVVIEVNPRLSGLTAPTAVLAGKSSLELLLAAGLESVSVPSYAAVPEKSEDRCEGNSVSECAAEHSSGGCSHSESRKMSAFKAAPACVLDVKLTVLADDRFEELCTLPYVYDVNQTANDDARQIRERGYCEVVLGAETPAALLARLNDLKALFPDELDDNFVESARRLILKAY